MEQRIEVQKNIERIRYSRMVWPKENKFPRPTFEEAVPDSLLEKKVEVYLLKSRALDYFWGRPLTGQQLQAEIERMVRDTKDPKGLQDLFSALGNDPTLIAECIARPALAERLIHHYYATDDSMHASARRDAEALLARLTPENFSSLGSDRYVPVHVVREMSSIAAGNNTIRLKPDDFKLLTEPFPTSSTISQVIETPEAFVIYKTETRGEDFLTGGVIRILKKPYSQWFLEEVTQKLSPYVIEPSHAYTLPVINDTGQRFVPVTTPNMWKPLWYIPEPRINHTAIWTGNEMIIWGGLGTDWAYLNSGGRYSPDISSWTWTSLNLEDCPEGRAKHTAVWTGREMIIWGGERAFNYLNSGGRYNPTTDSWIPTDETFAPSGRHRHTAVWTGREMIIWGGYDGLNFLRTGSRYDPTKDGSGQDPWDSTCDTQPTCNAPFARADHTAVWTGDQMIVWGGYGCTDATCSGQDYLNTGSRYNPTYQDEGITPWTDTYYDDWSPSKRFHHTAVWTGTSMLIWGGYGCADPPACTYSSPLNTGGDYHPSGNWWGSIDTTGAPTARAYHTAVWTGTNMIIWGGYTGSGDTDTGSRWDPTNWGWTVMDTTGAPTAREGHTAIWTGTEMIVWGGQDTMSNFFSSGGRYNPSLQDQNMDSWLDTAPSVMSVVPSARQENTAVWDGWEMIVWGGFEVTMQQSATNSGSRYEPVYDSWYAIDYTDPETPSPRGFHTAVWTGDEMIVWGGNGGGGMHLGDGGRYYPLSDFGPGSDCWVKTNDYMSPAQRYYHTAVWTGDKMIIWGGNGCIDPPTCTTWGLLNSGGQYDLFTDTWEPTTTDDCPTAREEHAAAWAGGSTQAMAIWGGRDASSILNDGMLYTPGTGAGDGGSWTTMNGTGAPGPRSLHTAVFAEEYDDFGDVKRESVIVWGGRNCASFMSGCTGETWLNDGGLYDLSTHSWTIPCVTSTYPCYAPDARKNHSALWTGTEMFIWGGERKGLFDETLYLNDGRMYDPGSDTWEAVYDYNNPTGRSRYTAVWADGGIIIWGGLPMTQSGGIYYPNTKPTPFPMLANDLAQYDPGYGTPACTVPQSFCDTQTLTTSLVDSRDDITDNYMNPHPEPNTPNTLDGCTDGDIGTYHQEESIDRIRISTLDGSVMSVGSDVRIDVTIWAPNNWTNAYLDLYHTYDPTPTPTWDYVETLMPDRYGLQTLSFYYTIPNGGETGESDSRAIRLQLRTTGSLVPDSPCVQDIVWGDSYERDDLVFTVSTFFQAPNFVLGQTSNLILDGLNSMTGSNPKTWPPYEDSYDSIPDPDGFEWFIKHPEETFTKDSCLAAVSGVDWIGSRVSLQESDFDYIVDHPGPYPIWLRVTDELGKQNCIDTWLNIEDGVAPNNVDLWVPDGGESWPYSPTSDNRKSQLIVWDAQDNFILSRYRLSYSTDAGTTWTMITDTNKDFSNTTPVAIPDDDPNGATSTIVVTDTQRIQDINVTVDITHTHDSDLTIILIAPDATEITLSSNNGGSGDNYTNTTFDDEAPFPIFWGVPPFTGNFWPEQPLSDLDFTSVNGTWTLKVIDDGWAGETGTLNSWNLKFTYEYDNSFWWSLPTQSEAAAAGQTFPSAECRVKVEVWDEAGNHDIVDSTDMSEYNFYIVQPTTTSVKTLILWNSERMCEQHDTTPGCSCADIFGTTCDTTQELDYKLEELAEHLKVTGKVLDLANIPAVKTAYTAWDSDPTDQVMANAVAQAIRSYLYGANGQISKTYTNTEYIMLVGDDLQIPFFRMTDGTMVDVDPAKNYSESKYIEEVDLNSSSSVGSALLQGYFLTDNYYSEYNAEESGMAEPHNWIYQNDYSIGRLVETPGQIEKTINIFLAQNGQLDAASPSDKVLVTGFDFIYDAAKKIKDSFRTAHGNGSVDCHLDDPLRSEDPAAIDCDVPDTDPTSEKPYPPSTFASSFLPAAPHKINSILTHANHYSFSASRGDTTSDDVLYCTDASYDATYCYQGGDIASSANNLKSSILYTSGCHSGLSIPSSDEPDTPLDLPEIMANKGVVGYIGNTGYAWAIKFGRGLTERLMQLFTDELLDNNSIEIGKALANAKRTYYLEEKRYDVFDEKVMHEMTLFGIPNYLIVTGTARTERSDGELPGAMGPDRGCAKGICVEKTLKSDPSLFDLPDKVTELELNFTFGAGTYELISIPSEGDYYELNGVASGETGDAIQPKFVYDSYLSGTNDHGVLFTGGTYTTESFAPLAAVPKSTATDPNSGAGPLPAKSAFLPGLTSSQDTKSVSGLRSEDSAYLNLVTHTAYYNGDTGIESKFDKMSFVVYYHKDLEGTPFPSTGAPVAIPDDDPSGGTSSILVSESGISLIEDVDIEMAITHPRVSDLQISLIGPDSTEIILSDGTDVSGSNFTETVLSDEASTALDDGTTPYMGTFQPDNSLTAFDGKIADGTWTLKAVDSVTGEAGTIDEWSLTFHYTAPVISDPGAGGFHTLEGMTAHFTVSVTDPSGVYRVVVTYNDTRPTESKWKSIDLTYNSSTGVWQGSLDLKGNITYYIQAVDNVGVIGQLTESGEDTNSNGVKYGSTWEYSKTFDITLADNDEGEGDGLPDPWEDLYSCVNSTTKDASIDFDQDGLTHLQEFENDTNPCDGDTDGGGDNDGSELNNGRSPLIQGDDKHITITFSKVPPDNLDYLIEWPNGTVHTGDCTLDINMGDNNIIDGPYWVYRSTDPYFDDSETLVTALATGTQCYLDDTASGDTYFYKVWNYGLDTPAPIVAAVLPSTGPELVQTSVTVYGDNFLNGATVTFCGDPATNVTVVTSGKITCKTPAHSAATCTVRVTNPNGQYGEKSGAYEFQ